MLQALRSSTSKLTLKLLFVVLIASFAVWGIGDMFRGNAFRSAPVEVGNVRIGPVQLQDEYRRQFAQLQARFGPDLDRDTANALGLPDRVVNDVVARALFQVFAEKSGMRVTDETVSQAIRADPVFRNDAGQFDRDRFNAWLRQAGMSEGELVARLRNEIVRGQLTGSVIAGVRAPEALVDRIHAYRAEERVAETLLVPAAATVEIALPDDAALEAFLEENADRYKTPELRAITMVRLSPADLAAEISIPEDEIAAAFEDRKSEFDRPERRHLEQIVFPDELTAKGAADELSAGGDFAEIARKATGGAPIDLGTIERDALVSISAALADAAFAVPEGQVTDPIETPLGWHLVRVLSVEPAKEATLAEHRDAIARELALHQAQDDIVSIANQFEDELAGGATLEEAAAKLDLELVEIPAIDAQGKRADGTAVEVDAARDVAALAFETPEGELSPLTETDDGGYYILRVNSVTPAATRPLSEVRGRVEQDWLAAQRAKMAAEKAAALVERINGGESMATVAAELGQEVKTSKPVRRDGSDAGAWLDTAAVARLFTLKQGEAAAAPAGGDQVIMRLTEIRKPGTTSDSSATAGLRNSLHESLAGEVINQFMAAVQQDVTVSIDRDAIENLF